MENRKKFIILDCHAIIHRAFHALPPLTDTSGNPANAVYGFLLILFRTIKDMNPDYLAAAFDLPGPTFRHEQFEGYKGTRAKAHQDLRDQIPKVRMTVEAFGIKSFSQPGFEADDIIATLAKKALNEKDIETVILTADYDVLQIVDEKTKVCFLRRGVTDTVLFDIEKIKEKFGGLLPCQLPDFKALKGDPSDNISGVKGIGEKTAIELIRDFGSIENLYKNLDESRAVLKERTGILLKEGKEKAFLSKKLSISKRDIPLEFNFKECERRIPPESASRVLKEFGFESLLSRISELTPKN